MGLWLAGVGWGWEWAVGMCVGGVGGRVWDRVGMGGGQFECGGGVAGKAGGGVGVGSWECAVGVWLAGLGVGVVEVFMYLWQFLGA